LAWLFVAIRVFEDFFKPLGLGAKEELPESLE